MSDNVGRPVRRGSVTNYHGPVFNGEVTGAQLAWNNTTVTQNHAHSEQVAPGFENVAQLVADMLRQLAGLGLPEQDARDAAEHAVIVLAEVVRP
ncbi:MAG: hypothetical protein M3443_08810, partial [Actinomycetota bacterium]|nr:hypothetical protein [Actinomycetota bacterium]